MFLQITSRKGALCLLVRALLSWNQFLVCSIVSSRQPVRLANVRPCPAQGESGAGGGGHVWANIGLGHICCPYQEPEWCY